MGCNNYYLKPIGILKLFEIIFLAIAFATVESQFSKVSISNRNDGVNFHIGACAFTFALCVLWFILNLFVNIIYKKCLKIVVAIIHLILGIVVMVAASLLLSKVASSNGFEMLKTGCAFGIIAAIFLIIEGFLHFCIKQYYSADEARTELKKDEEEEPKA